MPDNIFEYVKSEESAFMLPIPVLDGWEWSFRDHVRLSTLYKNSQFASDNDPKSRDDRPFKNIIRPILNLQYRTEGFDVKDVLLYVDDSEQYYKSFLVKYFHDRWAVEKGIDSLIDETIESVVDYGGALLKDLNGTCPEVVPLASIAFCDQTNMLSGPIGIKHFYSPDQLQSFESKGWGDPNNGATITIQDAIVLSQTFKRPDGNSQAKAETPGKFAETYEVHGVMPESWYKKDGNPDKYIRQMHILLFYKNEKGDREGATLYAGREADGLFDQLIKNKIHGRALGFGGVEELFDPQVWTNYGEIAKKGMLDAASKMIVTTTDQGLKTRHPEGLKNLDNLDVIEIEDGKSLTQVNISPVNIAAFDNAIEEWNRNAQSISTATDALLGETPASGTPFKLQDLITQQGFGIHEYQRGKNAVFFQRVYKKYILPDMVKDMGDGKKFLQELSLTDLKYVRDNMMQCAENDYVKEQILSGMEVSPIQIQTIRQQIAIDFSKKGSKHFLEIFKGEMADVPTEVQINIAGKQKDINKITDKIVNIIRQIIAAPQILQVPGMADLFNQIIEYSGLNPVDFSSVTQAPAPVAAPAPGDTPDPVIPNQAAAAINQ